MLAQPVYALDLGSTRFKLGRLSPDGRLADVRAKTAPSVSGSGLIRAGDPAEFLAAANALLATIPEPQFAALGLVSQRSTFTVWDGCSGEPIAPMISWLDRRADDWCAAHGHLEANLQRTTGLPLSAHYVGPKIAAMRATDPEFAKQLVNKDTLIGTLDTWLIWNWTGGKQHLTDLTMAARTSLVDLDRGTWSDDAMEVFGVPASVLPTTRTTSAWGLQLQNGLMLQTSVADQAAGTLAVLSAHERAALINFGTGAFVLYPTGREMVRRAGYLTGPIFCGHDGTDYSLEGTVNGAGPALDRFGAGPTEWSDVHDPYPDAFAIPDLAGLGSPYWRADVSLEFSAAGRDLGDRDKRRIVLEGLLFRVYEILLDLGCGELPERVVISGGLTRDPAVALGLASLLGCRIEVLREPEATLLGAARLAGGLDAYANPRWTAVEPTSVSAGGSYLHDKYGRWRAWLKSVLAR